MIVLRYYSLDGISSIACGQGEWATCSCVMTNKGLYINSKAIRTFIRAGSYARFLSEPRNLRLDY